MSGKNKNRSEISGQNSSFVPCGKIQGCVLPKKAILGSINIYLGKLDTVFLILTNLVYPIRVTNITNNKDKTALFYARDPKFMYLLLNYGADPSLGRAEKCTLLEEFVRTNPTNARALLNHELETNNSDINDKELIYVYKLRLLLTGSVGKYHIRLVSKLFNI